MLNQQELDALNLPDLIIEGNTAVWDLKVDGDINGTYRGTFRFKCYLSPTEQLSSGRLYREILGPNHISAPEKETWLAYALTQLRYRIVTSPPFWSSYKNSNLEGDLPDENVITAILDAAINSEIKYRAQLKQKRLQSIERAKSAIKQAMELEENQETDSFEDENGSRS